MLQEKQFFLKCLENGPLSQRGLANRISHRYTTSPSAIKEALLAEGLIELSHTKRNAATRKIHHYYKLTNKKMKVPDQKLPAIVADKWEDGTPKSRGNAFDLSASTKSMFDKSEIARMTQKYHQNKPITIYSRA
jgi:hypothetical protein